jgi:hypothetical protein
VGVFLERAVMGDVVGCVSCGALVKVIKDLGSFWRWGIWCCYLSTTTTDLSVCNVPLRFFRLFLYIPPPPPPPFLNVWELCVCVCVWIAVW